MIQAAASNDIKILSVVEAGQKAGFFDDYPFYTQLTIPAGTYSGVDYDVMSFQDSALWVAGAHVGDKWVESALEDIFSKEGLAYMVKVKSTAKAMSVDGALDGCSVPVHPGAAKFWTENGLTIPAAEAYGPRVDQLVFTAPRENLPPGFDPKSGSVSPKQPIARPAPSSGIQRSRCAGLPHVKIGYITSEVWTDTKDRRPESARSNSWLIRP